MYLGYYFVICFVCAKSPSPRRNQRVPPAVNLLTDPYKVRRLFLKMPLYPAIFRSENPFRRKNYQQSIDCLNDKSAVGAGKITVGLIFSLVPARAFLKRKAVGVVTPEWRSCLSSRSGRGVALTFCDATKSKQKAHQRGAAPLCHPPEARANS